MQLNEYEDRTLYTTWNLSYSRLQTEDPKAADFLKLLAYFDNQEFWYELFHAGLSEHQPMWLQSSLAEQASFESVMRTLIEYGLVEIRFNSCSYSMHNCVHDWTLVQLNQEVSRKTYWYAFDCVVASIDRRDRQIFGYITYARVSRHAVRLTHHWFQGCDEAENGLSERLEEAVDIVGMLRAQAQFYAAHLMCQRVLAGKEKVYGPEHVSTLRTVGDLGRLYRTQEKLKEAEQMHIRALSGSEKLSGPDHPMTLDIMNSLGLLYRDQDKMEEAEQMFMRSIAGYERALGPDHVGTCKALNNLGGIYYAQGNLDETEQMFTRALTV